MSANHPLRKFGSQFSMTGVDPKATFQRRKPNPGCNCSYLPLYPDILTTSIERV